MPPTRTSTTKRTRPAPVAPRTAKSAPAKKEAAQTKRKVGRSNVQQSTSTSQSRPNINTPSSKILDVYVFGTNCYGELGLGDATKKTELPRPVLNPKLPADTVGITYLTIGGVHSAAITHDNKILTWGVNDDGALGRDTTIEANDVKMKDADEEDSDDEDEANYNLKEATPLSVESKHFPRGTVFTQLAATGSATFVLTADGLVYGWGAFTDNSGNKQFAPDGPRIQKTPVLLAGLERVTQISAGAEHVLALTAGGAVFSWGSNEQSQLGRRRVTRNAPPDLAPAECAVPSDIVSIGTGSYHSFAVTKTGAVYGWGSNNFGQTAIFTAAGQSGAIVAYPTKASNLKGITQIQGGKDHSLAINRDGRCLSWGRIDNKALGIETKDLPESGIITDEYDRPRILKTPMAIANIENAVGLGIGTDHSFVITGDGHAYSWGFNVQRQTGQASSDDEIVIPTVLSNKHVDGKKLVLAAAGGQFSMVAGEHQAA
ncbi:RCC1-like domain-containing protein [Aspergillus stella-maris]|uniref:RCC1-like domain-containing protein n=1 Tax=Aspergillus stella-maris TaxID=1810926 RepID=UPI003CCD2C2C